MSKKLVLNTAVLFIMGCGSSEPTPRGVADNNSIKIPASGKLAECSKAKTNGLNIIAQASTHYSYGALDKEIIQINIAQPPTEILSSDKYSLKFFRWKELIDGQAQVNSVPTPIKFKSKITGEPVGNPFFNEISRPAIQNFIAQYSLSSLNITVNNFFNNYYVLLSSVDYQWQAITIAYYDSSVGTSAIANADVLLPPYFANPNVHAAHTSSTRLQALHPLSQYLNSGATENDYAQMANSICYELFGTVRNPASEPGGYWEKFIHQMSSWLASVRSFLGHFFGL